VVILLARWAPERIPALHFPRLFEILLKVRTRRYFNPSRFKLTAFHYNVAFHRDEYPEAPFCNCDNVIALPCSIVQLAFPKQHLGRLELRPMLLAALPWN
jgi:hypothetical protein